MNREGDATCYQCSKSFADMEASLPPTAGLVGRSGSGNAGIRAAAKLDLGEILGESFQLYFKTFPQLAAIAAVLGLVLVMTCLFAVLAVVKLGPFMALFALPVLCLITPVFWASHMRLLLASKRDEKLTLGQIFTVGVTRGIGLFITLLVVSVAAIVAFIGVSFTLSMVFGSLAGPVMLILLIALLVCSALWFLFVPCSVLEDHIFFSGFSRSSQLVSPHFGHIAVLALLAWALGGAASSLPQFFTAGAVGTIAQIAIQSQMPAQPQFPVEGFKTKDGSTIKFDMPSAPAPLSTAKIVSAVAIALIPIGLAIYFSILGGALSLVFPFVVYWKLTGGGSLSPGI